MKKPNKWLRYVKIAVIQIWDYVKVIPKEQYEDAKTAYKKLSWDEKCVTVVVTSAVVISPSIALAVRASFISSTVASGLYSLNIATAPATKGAAMEVPLSILYSPSL